MMGAQEWEDETDRVRWQPRLENGHSLWDHSFIFEVWSDYRPRACRPVLYRSKRRAERVAAREERRRRRRFEVAS